VHKGKGHMRGRFWITSILNLNTGITFQKWEIPVPPWNPTLRKGVEQSLHPTETNTTQEQKMINQSHKHQSNFISCRSHVTNRLTCNWKNVVSKPAPRDNTCFGFSSLLFFPALRNWFRSFLRTDQRAKYPLHKFGKEKVQISQILDISEHHTKENTETVPTTIDYRRPPCCTPNKKAHVIILHVSFVNTRPATQINMSC